MFTFRFLKLPTVIPPMTCVFVTPPQSSKTMLRTLSGVLLSMVAMLGRPFGVGKGSAGKFMFLVAPETTMVTSATGYENCPATHELDGAPRPGHGWGKSKLCRDGLQSGSIPLGKFESRYGETDAF